MLQTEPDRRVPSRRANESAPGRWRRWLTGRVAAGVILAAFWVLLQASLWEKSVTHDEVVHAAGGYSYWRFNDYRIQPENGNLPQRVAALPLLSYPFPSRDSSWWRDPDQWSLAEHWFYRMGNDAVGMRRRGRAVCGLLAVALGALVWWWARRLFGPWGGMLSLLLYVLDPTILANGALMTSDLTAALFFLAATLAWWRLLHRVSLGSVVGCGLAVGGLFASKMSAPLIVPVAAALLAFRLLDRRPLSVVLPRWRGELAGPRRTLLALAGATVAQAALAGGVIWGLYGFRFAMRAPGSAGSERQECDWAWVLGKPKPLDLLNRIGLTPAQLQRVPAILEANHVSGNEWTPEMLAALRSVRREVLRPAEAYRLEAALEAPPSRWLPRLADFARRHQLLPEAFVYGYAFVWQSSLARTAFLNGRAGIGGWRTFFPYSFLVKTPPATFAVMLLALAAAAWRWRRGGSPAGVAAASGWSSPAAETLPLWTLWAAYWAAAVANHVDIGHRHLLPTYPPLFILCGVAAAGVASAAGATDRRRGRLERIFGGAVVVALVALALEVAGRFPNYLAYFNCFAGGPAQGYRHLVDSSLDWGQELPAVKRYLDRHPTAQPVYFSYFGMGSPDWYGIPALPLCSKPGLGQAEAALFRFVDLPGGDPLTAVGAIQRREPGYDVVGTVTTRRGLSAVLLRKSAALRLVGGTYLISATLLEPVRSNFEGGLGLWNRSYEEGYQQLRGAVAPLLDDDGAVRANALNRHSPEEWTQLMLSYEHLRFARLTAFLRHREPDATINYSVLVYRLTAADLARALDGPPAELAADPAWMKRRAPPGG